nr:UDP-glycosyltransferase [Paris polyphylla]
MGSESQPILHVLFFPMMAAGHMIPMVDMARLFAARGVKATIVITPANSDAIRSTVDRAKTPNIEFLIVPFPFENLSAVSSLEFRAKFLQAMEMLRDPFDRILADHLPDCVITDMFFPWSADVAAKHNVPRLVFHGSCCFSHCAMDAIVRYNIVESSPTDVESFVVPGLPHRIGMLKSQIPDHNKSMPALGELLRRTKESEERSYGVVVNSFYELEPDYVRHYREVMGRRAWLVGPVSLSNANEADMLGRGGNKISSHACLDWLDGKEPGSVLYVCFGSLGDFTAAQLNELAVGLDASGVPFVWVVRKGATELLPASYEERVEGRGMVVEGWAPQISILNHRAVGGFLTHCGWNSSIEGISAGLPMATWPLYAEQFYNERLLVEVLEVGVAVGIEKCIMLPEDRPVVGAASVERAVGRLMGGGEETERRRQRAREFGDMAKAAVADGGSSFVEMGNLIKELTGMRNLTTKTEA